MSMNKNFVSRRKWIDWPEFEEYSQWFSEYFKMKRKNGILEVRMHYDDGPVVYSYQMHNTYGPGMRYALFGPYLIYQLTGGEGGFRETMCGPMGQSLEAWLKSMCTWDHWPDEARTFFSTDAPQEIRRIMQRRAPGTGRTNEELTRFRDKGLLELLKYHQLI